MRGEQVRQALLAYIPCCPQETADRLEMLRLLDTHADLLTRQNTTAHFTASALTVDPAGIQTLMAWHNLYQSWSWLGGHADGEEDLPSVALREVLEESGLPTARLLSRTPIAVDILPVWGHVKHGAFVCTHLHLNLTYLVEAPSDLPLLGKPDENTGVRWLPLEEMPTTTSEREMAPVYEKLIRQYKMWNHS